MLGRTDILVDEGPHVLPQVKRRRIPASSNADHISGTSFWTRTNAGSHLALQKRSAEEHKRIRLSFAEKPDLRLHHFSNAWLYKRLSSFLTLELRAQGGFFASNAIVAPHGEEPLASSLDTLALRVEGIPPDTRDHQQCMRQQYSRRQKIRQIGSLYLYPDTEDAIGYDSGLSSKQLLSNMHRG